MKILSLGGILSLLLILLYIPGYNPLGFQTFPFFGLLYGSFTLLIPLLLWIRIKNKISGSDMFGENICFEIDENSLTIQSPSVQKTILLKDLYEVHFLPDSWLCYGTPGSFFYIPVAAVSDEEQKKISRWFKQKVNRIR